MKNSVLFTIIAFIALFISCKSINEPEDPTEDPTPGRLVAAVATIGPAENITRTSATLIGYVTANEKGTTVAFEYRTDKENFYRTLKMKGFYTGTSPQKVIGVVNDLMPGTNYRYRLRPANKAGSIASREAYFSTLE
jgi:hypothetical protein